MHTASLSVPSTGSLYLLLDARVYTSVGLSDMNTDLYVCPVYVRGGACMCVCARAQEPVGRRATCRWKEVRPKEK